ncbi:hypothetical protein CYY_004556 [Polysphondylium violaceum]|uniref:Phosphoribosyltransferase domain-containing protein n=1 Tax=Polysphondylium violaceum TaxID=133409 RepID=A0A8J4PUG4_9MYCE|nr:hypothetical protein CYY_004556 [Polysphondylium violaceum]
MKTITKILTTTKRIFKDRESAGNELATYIGNELKGQPLDNAIVLGLPRGGVPTAFCVAEKLSCPLDIVVPRKIGAPGHEEYAIGAIDENGQGYLNQSVIEMMGISQRYLHQQIELEKKESQRRRSVYRSGKSPIELKDKLVILVDDGIATGSTMKAAIESVYSKSPREIIVAVPVAPDDTLQDIQEMKKVDKIFCLCVPSNFQAVGCFYKVFDQTSDETVIRLMNKK